MLRSRALRRWILASTVLATLGAGGLRAHTRERDRIAAFEEAQEKRNALMTQGIKVAQDASVRLEEELKARAEHARHLSGQVEALRTDVTAGLGSVVGSVTAAMGPPLLALETRIERRRLELLAVEAARSAQGDASLQASLDTLTEAQQLAAASAKAEAAELRKSLQGFRDYLKQFAESVEGRLGKLDGELAALKQQQVDDRKEADRRREALLKAISQENLKLRRAVQQLAGATGAPGHHVVQKGESLYGIAKLYGVSLDALEKANPELTKPGVVVHPGTKVIVPER